MGLEGAIQHFDSLIDQAGKAIPDCACRDMLTQMVLLESQRLVPKSMCEAYRKRVASTQPLKPRMSRTRATRQQQIIE
jgi:geranylgeranyl diphosphate synthase type II